MANLIDLEELVLNCRSDNGRKYIQEAVSCYQVGSYRAAIISTWLAIVFDFLAKLRELDTFGIASATSLLKQVETWHDNKDIKSLSRFEDDVLEYSENSFQLITHIDRRNLERIKEDRNLCAHPSLVGELPFTPSAELARNHLFQAVDIYLKHPAALGTPAFVRICETIINNGFPGNFEQAIEYLRSRLLSRPSEALIKKLIKALATMYLKEERTDEERLRIIAAIKAILIMHPNWGQKTFTDSVNNKITELLDTDYWRLYSLCREFSDLFAQLSEETKIRSQELLKHGDRQILRQRLNEAIHIIEIAEIAKAKIEELNAQEIAELAQTVPNPRAVEVAKLVSDFVSSSSFTSSENNSKSLARVSQYLDVTQLKAVIRSFSKNNQNFYAWKTMLQMYKIFSYTRSHSSELKDEWQSVYNRLKDRLDESDAKTLYEALEQEYPDFSSAT